VCTLVPTWYVMKSRSLTVFTIRQAEHRYAAVGEYLGRTLPPKAIVLTMIESGSVRLYGARLTLRWDMLDPDRLDGAIETLRAAGYYPYLLLEDWELPLYRQLFSAANAYGRVEWPPAFEYRDLARVGIYDFADRDRYLDGQPIATRRVPIGE
jgi:hypothetical protein